MIIRIRFSSLPITSPFQFWCLLSNRKSYIQKIIQNQFGVEQRPKKKIYYRIVSMNTDYDLISSLALAIELALASLVQILIVWECLSLFCLM